MYGRVIKLYSEKLHAGNKGIVQRTADEIQREIDRQKELLEEKDREIEELKKHSFERLYDIMTSLEKHTTEEILFYTAQTLSDIMDTKDVAIYTVVNRDYARLFSATSSAARQLGNSLKYTTMGNLYDDLKGGRVYMNKNMEEGRPIMASAIYAEEEIRVIVMFWGIPSQRLTKSEANRLLVSETLLQNAVLRASRYMASFRSKRYLEGTNVLNEEAFTELVKSFFKAKANGLTECTLLEFEMGYHEYKSISIQVANHIRQTDYMGVMEGGTLYILLCNTDLENAKSVQERLQKLGYESRIKETAE